MSARRPNYTAVGDDGAPDLELTSRNPFNDQSAQEDKNIGHSSTRNPLVDDADADEVDLKKGADATAAKAEECEMMDLRCLDLQVRPVRLPGCVCDAPIASYPSYKPLFRWWAHGNTLAGAHL